MMRKIIAALAGMVVGFFAVGALALPVSATSDNPGGHLCAKVDHGTTKLFPGYGWYQCTKDSEGDKWRWRSTTSPTPSVPTSSEPEPEPSVSASVSTSTSVSPSVSTTSPVPSTSTQDISLPVTGAPVTIFAVGGLILLVGGVVLFLAARSKRRRFTS